MGCAYRRLASLDDERQHTVTPSLPARHRVTILSTICVIRGPWHLSAVVRVVKMRRYLIFVVTVCHSRCAVNAAAGCP